MAAMNETYMLCHNESYLWNGTDFPFDMTDNCTSDTGPAWKTKLMLSYKILLSVLLCLIMVPMGCTISLQEVWKHLKKPIGIGFGAIGQFIVLPLLAFGFSHMLKLRPEEAIGLFMVSTCPGGTVSNIFTYWVDGDVSLSVSMTTVSTLLSFGMMPLNLWIYTRSWAAESFVVPYVNIVIVLATILVPVFVGQLIKWRSRKAAIVVAKIGSISGVVAILIVIIMQMILFPAMFSTNWRILFATFTLPASGFICSYIACFLCRMPANFCCTVGIETGCQNVSMAVSVIALSYPESVFGLYSLPSVIYGTSMTAEGILLTLCYKLHLRLKKKHTVTHSMSEEEKGMTVSMNYDKHEFDPSVAKS